MLSSSVIHFRTSGPSILRLFSEHRRHVARGIGRLGSVVELNLEDEQLGGCPWRLIDTLQIPSLVGLHLRVCREPWTTSPDGLRVGVSVRRRRKPSSLHPGLRGECCCLSV